jgi:hypothetical protein
MKFAAAVLFLSAAFLTAEQNQTFTGVITDSMCGANHAAMKISPDSKCAMDCVKSSSSIKYALNDGSHTYKLSDQAAPAQFAGRRVKVTGVLFPKTSIIQVTKIEAEK